jgi:hypothetical protein
MATQLNFRNHWRSKLNQWLDSSLYGLSTYATPIAIVLISVFALVNWPAQYEASGTPIAFHVIKDVNARLTPDEARRLLDLEPLSTFQDTELSPAPFWIKFDAAVGQTRSDDVIEFPSRHATEIIDGRIEAHQKRICPVIDAATPSGVGAMQNCSNWASTPFRGELELIGTCALGAGIFKKIGVTGRRNNRSCLVCIDHCRHQQKAPLSSVRCLVTGQFKNGFTFSGLGHAVAGQCRSH